MIIAAALAAAMAASPATAEARNLRLAEAELAVRAALAPAAVEAVQCFRPAARPSGSDRRRALCLVAHPAPAGEICRSLVMVAAPRGRYRAARARVIRRQVCLPFPDLQGL